MNRILAMTLMTLLATLGLASGPASAGSEDKWNTYFVWVDKDVVGPDKLKSVIEQFQGNAEKIKTEILAVYDGLGAFAVKIEPGGPQSDTNIDIVVKSLNFPAGALMVAAAGSNIHAMNADPEKRHLCRGKQPLPASPSAADTPWGVCRVGGHSGTATHKVWIIDSGIDINSPYLTIDWTNATYCADNSASCSVGFPAGSTDHSAFKDNLHHGTMVAGVIAAKPSGGIGIFGVAPGATVVPVKIFENKADISETIAMKGIYAVYNNANALPGDVVNISWGALWDWNGDYLDSLGRAVRRLADDKGLFVVVAAGNFLPKTAADDGAADLGGGWVNVITPARAGNYHSTQVHDHIMGMVLTVSAVDQNDKFWAETLDTSDSANPVWRGSFFGDGPPDYAEPGVDITTLWNDDKSNTCTGTSLAAPHLAGILLKGQPWVPAQPRNCGSTNPSNRARSDPDDQHWSASSNQFSTDTSEDDGIGECCAP